MIDFVTEMQKLFGERFRQGELMQKHTTWRVGGPADYFVETATTEEFVQALKIGKVHGIDVLVIGGGSNILIGDKGVRGLVVKHTAREFEVLGDLHGTHQQVSNYRRLVSEWEDHDSSDARHISVHYHFFDERNPNYKADSVFVYVSSGYTMGAFIEKMFQLGITGLERFARIPGTFGGWVYNNVHAHTQFIGEFVHMIDYVDERDYPHSVSWRAMEFMYNHSRFHGTRHAILGGILRLYRGNVEEAREIYKDVLKQKLDKQPSNSAGSVFHNLTAEEAAKHDFESVSAGYVIDKVLDWKGKKRVGGAWISEKNGNFIETDESVKAADIVELVQMIKNEFVNRFQIYLQEEFFRVGEF